jgi:hypothetical protein
MRNASRLLFAIALVLAGTQLYRARGFAILADDVDKGVAGNWKLVVLAFGEDEFAIVKIEPNDGKPTGSVVTAQKMVLGDRRTLKVDEVAVQGGSVRITLKGPSGTIPFQGQLVREGRDSGKILGTFHFRGEIYPARLQRTDSQVIADLKPSPLIQEYFQASQDHDPKSKVKKLREAVKKHGSNPTNYLFYGDLLAAAESAGLEASEVGSLAEAWLKAAEPYGATWVSEVRQKALKSLGSAKPYAGLTLDLAQQADKELGEQGSIEQKAAVVAILAKAAKLAGKADIAAAALARSAKLEGLLDEEYHKRVPPFQTRVYEGRKDPKADRVVLMELFTGAQCPPCVAADVAFDALLKTYKPTELIGLQYHLHIPGPDPLTNKDTQDRQQYYGSDVNGTPSTFFNGHAQAGGGGPMQASEQKYNEYRQIIGEQLRSSKEAAIEVSAARSGDEIEITAEATIPKRPSGGESATAKEDTPKKVSGESAKSAAKFQPRLRLALTEEAVRYVGGNKLRYHHHVVRDFPGGIEGRDLSSGSGQLKVKLKLGELKRDIEAYLAEYTKMRPFPNALPDIALEDLSVVAFVQDDADKSILHAVSVPVK